MNVVKEFRQSVQMIEEINPEFKVIHGQIVNNHDILGLRASELNMYTDSVFIIILQFVFGVLLVSIIAPS